MISLRAVFMSKPIIEKIHIPGLVLNARVWGPAEGLPVLGMHGWLDNAATFDLIAPLLPMLRLVSVDFPGHGFSDYLPACVTYNNVDRALQMFQVADALGWSQFSIIGHSLGGVVGELMSAIAPERINKLVLIDIFKPLSKPDETIITQLQKYLQINQNPYPRMVYKSLEEATTKRVNAKTVGSISLAAARALVKGGIEKISGGYVWTYDSRLLGPPALRWTDQQVKTIMENINVDCLLIIASDGVLTDHGEAYIDAEKLPKLQVCRLKGDHHLHLDDPAAVAAVLINFFNQ